MNYGSLESTYSKIVICSHHNINFGTNSCPLQNTPFTSQTFTNNFNEMELFSLYDEVSINKVQSQTYLLPLYLATKNFVFQQQNVSVKIIKQKKSKVIKDTTFLFVLSLFLSPFYFYTLSLSFSSLSFLATLSSLSFLASLLPFLYLIH